MPICCEPGERYAVVLDGDKGKSPEPTFWCQHLSARQFRIVSDLGQAMADAGSLEEQLELLDKALRMAVCGWEHITNASGEVLTFQPELLLDVLTVAEAGELLGKIAAGQRISGQDAKKSDSPSPSDLDNTAAAGGPGVVVTVPAPSSP